MFEAIYIWPFFAFDPFWCNCLISASMSSCPPLNFLWAAEDCIYFCLGQGIRLIGFGFHALLNWHALWCGFRDFIVRRPAMPHLRSPCFGHRSLVKSCKSLALIHWNSVSAHFCHFFGLQWFGVSDHDGATLTGHPRPQATQLEDGAAIFARSWKIWKKQWCIDWVAKVWQNTDIR